MGEARSKEELKRAKRTVLLGLLLLLLALTLSIYLTTPEEREFSRDWSSHVEEDFLLSFNTTGVLAVYGNLTLSSTSPGMAVLSHYSPEGTSEQSLTISDSPVTFRVNGTIPLNLSVRLERPGTVRYHMSFKIIARRPIDFTLLALSTALTVAGVAASFAGLARILTL